MPLLELGDEAGNSTKAVVLRDIPKGIHLVPHLGNQFGESRIIVSWNGRRLVGASHETWWIKPVV